LHCCIWPPVADCSAFFSPVLLPYTAFVSPVLGPRFLPQPELEYLWD
jgi:hypothetical protein